MALSGAWQLESSASEGTSALQCFGFRALGPVCTSGISVATCSGSAISSTCLQKGHLLLVTFTCCMRKHSVAFWAMLTASGSRTKLASVWCSGCRNSIDFKVRCSMFNLLLLTMMAVWLQRNMKQLRGIACCCTKTARIQARRTMHAEDFASMNGLTLKTPASHPCSKSRNSVHPVRLKWYHVANDLMHAKLSPERARRQLTARLRF